MIAPTFEPGGTTTQAVNTGLSWMERGQQAQMRQQEIERARREEQEAIDLAPVRILKSEADRMAYHAQIANAQIMEETRRQAAINAPQALAEFTDIIKIPDFDEKARALDEFAGKYAWLGNLPENKQFIDSVNDARGKAHLDSIAMGKIAQAKEAAMQRAVTGEQQVEQRAKAAELKAQTDIQLKAKDEEIAKLKAASSERVAGQRNETTRQRPAEVQAVKANEGMLVAGQEAMAGIRDAQRAMTLLDEVRTGTGAQLEQSSRRVGQLLGVDTSTAKAEELQRILGDAVLKRVNQTKGSISDKEMVLFDRYSASMGKSAEGNKAILSAYVKGLQRSVEIAKMVNDLRREGVSEREIQLEVNDFILNNPITDADFGGAQAGGGAANMAFDDPGKERRYQELKAKAAERAAPGPATNKK